MTQVATILQGLLREAWIALAGALFAFILLAITGSSLSGAIFDGQVGRDGRQATGG